MLHIRHHEHRVGLSVGTPHPPAELIELSEPEHLRLIHDERIRPGKVQSRFHNGRTHQHVELAVPEFVHGIFEFLFGHLTVRHTHTGRRHEFLHHGRRLGQGLHPVVHEEHLTLPGQLTFHDLPQRAAVPVDDGRGHGLALGGRGFQHGKLAYAGHGKLKRAGNGRGRKSKSIHVFAQFLQLFLVTHAETLLLVENEQAEIGQLHVLGKQTVRTYENIYLPPGRSLQGFRLPGSGHETAEQPHIDGEARHA